MLDSITNSMDMRLSKLRETLKDRKPGVLHPWGSKESDMTELLSNKNKYLCKQEAVRQKK